jgi:hypothetical protein
LLNGSADEDGGIDQRFNEHGESIHPKAVRRLGGYGMETPVCRRRDVQDPHAVGFGLAELFHLEGQQLLAQELVEGLPEKVF